MEPIRLRTGRDVRIRQIRPSDAHALKLAYARLSPRSKYQRFLAPKPQLSTADTRYLTEVDGEHHYALVATPADEPELIIGVGRYVRLSDDPLTAEFAIVVGDEFQGEGLATELLERLAAAAREGGVERFTATMLADNRPAHRLDAPARRRRAGAARRCRGSRAGKPSWSDRRGRRGPGGLRASPADMIGPCPGS